MASGQPPSEKIRLGPQDNLYYYKELVTSAPALAGLLGFSNTQDMGLWFESKNVKDLWQAYRDFRMRGFGGITAKTIWVSLKDCMELWSNESIKEFLRSDDIAWHETPEKTRPFLVTVWYARRLVMENPEVFSKFVGYPEGTENIARGVRCFRLMWERNSKNMTVAPKKIQPAIPVAQYFSRCDSVHHSSEGSSAHVERSDAPSTPDGPIPLSRQRKPWSTTINKLLEQIERDLDLSDDSLLGSISSHTIGIRPALRVEFMNRIADKVVVSRIGNHHSLTADRSFVEMAGNAGGINTSEMTDDELVATNSDATLMVEETEAFWKLQSAMTSLSAARLPDYDDAKLLFQTNDRGEPCVEGDDLVLKPWQVVGVQWMLDQEASPIAGGIIADGCGLGKTIQTLAFLTVSIKRLEASTTFRRPHKPTLIIAPSSVIQVWTDTYIDYFSNFFQMRLLHSRRSPVACIKHLTLTRNEMEVMWELGGIADPRVGKTRRFLLVTTYDMLARRFNAVNDEDEPGQLRWAARFARVVCDEGHRIKSEKTESWRAVNGLQAKFKWILSATPLINRITDYLGYLRLFFKEEWAGETMDSDGGSGEQSDQPYRDFLALDPPDQTIENGLHLLDPKLFSRNIVLGDMPMERAKHVLQSLSCLFQLQRTTASMVDVGGGKLERVGNSIPPFFASTIELEFSKQAQAEYQSYHGELYDQLKRWNPKGGENTNEPVMFFNNKFLRRLSHVSFSPLLERFARRVPKNGVKEIEEFRKYTDRGARLFTRQTTLDWGMPVPRCAADLVEFLTNACPKLGYLCGILAEIVLEKGEKLVIFTEWPMIMWMTEMLLGLLDINFITIRASTRPDDRIRIMRQFNNKNDSTLVLLTTFRTCSLGINLQGACHQMVVLETARNINTLLQAIGRIHRIGQTRQQYVKILFCDHTFNRWQEYICTRKFMAQLSGSNWGREVSEDIIMQLLGQPVPRLPMWELDFPQVGDSLVDDESSDGGAEGSDSAGDEEEDKDEDEGEEGSNGAGDEDEGEGDEMELEEDEEEDKEDEDVGNNEVWDQMGEDPEEILDEREVGEDGMDES